MVAKTKTKLYNVKPKSAETRVKLQIFDIS
jgi:hypothetical protein